MITQKEISATLAAVDAKTITATAAVDTLVAGGFDLQAAREAVFIALGGGDLIVTDDAGVDRYELSGRSVDEVDADMAR